MNPQEAHQIANPQILTLLNRINPLQAKLFLTGNDIFNGYDNKSILQGILIAQEKELSFLNEISTWHEEFSIAYIKMVDERREALEISCEDLRGVLK